MIKEVKMFTIVCNICGRDANEGDEFAAWTEIDPTYDNAENSGWYMEKHDEDIHYCMNCHSFDEDDNLVVNSIDISQPKQV